MLSIGDTVGRGYLKLIPGHGLRLTIAICKMKLQEFPHLQAMTDR